MRNWFFIKTKKKKKIKKKKKKKRVGEGVVGQLPVYQYDSGGAVELASLKVPVISLAYSI